MAFNANHIHQPYVPGDHAVPFLEKASQAFPAFWPVKLTAGQVEAWVATTGTASVDTSSTTFVGFAGRAASGTTDTVIPVNIVRTDSVVELPLYHATSTSATHSSITIGSAYPGIAVSGKFYINTTTTDNGCFKIIEKCPGYASTEPYAPVRAKVITVLAFP